MTKQDDLLEKIDLLIEKRIAPIEKRQKRQGKEFRKNFELIISFFDRDGNRLRKRVDRLETHAGLPPFE